MTAGTSVGGIVAAVGMVLSETSVELALAGLAGGVAILYLTYRFFRHGSEIIEGEFKEKRASAKQTLRELQDVAKMIQRGGY